MATSEGNEVDQLQAALEAMLAQEMPGILELIAKATGRRLPPIPPRLYRTLAIRLASKLAELRQAVVEIGNEPDPQAQRSLAYHPSPDSEFQTPPATSSRVSAIQVTVGRLV